VAKIDPAAWKRVTAATKQVENSGRRGTGAPTQSQSTGKMAFNSDRPLKITSVTTTDGRYPVDLLYLDAATNTYVDSGIDAWVLITPAPAVNDIVFGKPSGLRSADGLAVFDGVTNKTAVEDMLAGPITVREVDGTPTYASVHTIHFDQARGLYVTQPAAGEASVGIQYSTYSTYGVVNGIEFATSGSTVFSRVYQKMDIDARTYAALGSSYSALAFEAQDTLVGSDTTKAVTLYGCYDNAQMSAGALKGVLTGDLFFSMELYPDGGSGVDYSAAFRFGNTTATLAADADYNQPKLYVISGYSGGSRQWSEGLTTTVGGMQFVCGWFVGGSPGLSDGDYGLFTVLANVATLANDTVTFAKMQNIASDRLIGRDTAGSGDPEEISLDTTLEFTGAQVIRRAALTGDITAAAGSNATTIGNNIVTYAKMQDVSAPSRLLGRGDSGVGDPQEISLGTGLSMSGTTVNCTVVGISDGDKGDITVSASGTTWTIDTGAVTADKLGPLNGFANATPASADRFPFYDSSAAANADCSLTELAAGILLEVLASQADVETNSSTTVVMTPGRMRYDPGIAKFWVKFAGSTGSMAANKNVTSITRNATGDYTINFTSGFSGADYVVVAFIENHADGTFGAYEGVHNGSMASASVRIKFLDGGAAAKDYPSLFVVGFGDF
jgi:hypothetical protein